MTSRLRRSTVRARSESNLYPWTPELTPEQQALGLVRFLCAKRPGKERLIESIRGDATISEPVRRRALELAETFWERHMAAESARERNE